MSKGTIEQAMQAAIGHYRSGRRREAEAVCREILAVQPRHAGCLNLLGVIAGEGGQLDVAVDLIRRAIAVDGTRSDYHLNLGIFLRMRGRLDEAIASYDSALVLKSQDARVHNELGNAWTDKGEVDKAVICYQRSLSLRPNFAEAHYNLGHVLIRKGENDQAIECFRRTLMFKPDFPEAYNNLGNILLINGEVDEAIQCFRRAVVYKPDNAETHFNLGIALTFKGDFDGVIECYRRALAIAPRFVEAHNHLGSALREIGQLDEAITCYRQALEINPNSINAHNSLLLALHCHPASDSESLYLERLRWNCQHVQALKVNIEPHLNDRTPTRRLRIGYVSSDFRDHPVGRFILPLLALLDREAFEVFCYANVSASDEMTLKLRAHSEVWRSVVGLSDEQAARMIRRDGIDILVDLGMHTAKNRLLIFAHKPAPLQVTYLAYAGGTGLETIDYRPTDQYLDPAEADDRYYMEKSIRLEGTYWCYQESSESPLVNNAPASVTGIVTLGSLNNFGKVSRGTLETWAKILHAVPKSRLLLHTPVGSHRESLKRFLDDRGISSERLEMVGRMPSKEYFQTYHRVDIALDPFPFGGATTTCDALWMGVPVITLAGRIAVGRAGVSILSNAGVPELIARSPEQYVQIATDLANDLPRLIELRSTLRQRVQNSALMDAPRFARDIEAAYRQIWRKWCATSCTHF